MNVKKSIKSGMIKEITKSKKLSLIASGLILSSSLAFGADTIDAAFKDGKVSGSLIGYSSVSENADTLSTGNIGLAYKTGSYNGFSGKVGFFGSHAFEEDDANSSFEKNAIMSEANLTYTLDNFGSLTVGRQAVSLEWMGDYQEAALATITAIPDTTIVLAFSDKKGVAAKDEITDFYDINGSNGAYVADVKYTGLKGFEFNPYFYSAPDLANFYGLKTTYSADMFGAVAHYAASSEDVGSDGSVGHIELNTVISGVSAAVGYIKTDKDAGVASISKFGDSLSPLDSGNFVFSTDAKTAYGKLGYTIANVDLGAVYGQTSYSADDYKEKELNLTAGYSITDSLSTSLLYGNISADSNDSTTADNNYGSITVEYTF